MQGKKKKTLVYGPHEYVANKIPLVQRILMLLLSSGLITFGIWLLSRGHLEWYGRRTKTIHTIEGTSLWLIFLAIVFAAVNILLMVVDHYDKRNNEQNYAILAKVTGGASFCSLALGLFMSL